MSEKKQDLPEQGAIVQRDGETYALTPRIPCGLITDFSLLRRLADAAERHGARAIKLTSAQRLAVIGLREEAIAAFWQDAGFVPGVASGLCIRGIKACPGSQYCRFGQQDALATGLRIEERYAHLAMPNKFKISVSGCPFDCAEAQVRDVGAIGTKKGFRLYVGGAVGASPRVGQRIADELSADEVVELVGKIIDAYQGLGSKKRLGRALEDTGLEAFVQQLGLSRPAS